MKYMFNFLEHGAETHNYLETIITSPKEVDTSRCIVLMKWQNNQRPVKLCSSTYLPSIIHRREKRKRTQSSDLSQNNRLITRKIVMHNEQSKETLDIVWKHEKLRKRMFRSFEFEFWCIWYEGFMLQRFEIGIIPQHFIADTYLNCCHF